MWYPTQEQQQQYSWYGYSHQPSLQQQQQQQQQQAYSRTSYYYNDDELSSTCVENESLIHCQPTHRNDCYVIASNNSYGDEMSSYPMRKPYWSPVISAPTKMLTTTSSSLPVSSNCRPSSSPPSDCWDWLLFSPQYYSEFYMPSSTFVHYQKFDEEENDSSDLNFLASLPTCLLALLYLTPKLFPTSNDENDNDQEITSLHRSDEFLLSSIEKRTTSDQTNRSSTPDTDDGYQSASDYSQQLPVPSDNHHRSNDDITVNERSLPTPLMPQRATYAAAAKPVLQSSGKSQQNSKNEASNSNGQKMKFIAPRFERMHHAKQYASSNTSSSSTTTSSNRTQIRSNTNNNHNHHHHHHHHQRNPIVNPTRRR